MGKTDGEIIFLEHGGKAGVWHWPVARRDCGYVPKGKWKPWGALRREGTHPDYLEGESTSKTARREMEKVGWMKQSL